MYIHYISLFVHNLEQSRVIESSKINHNNILYSHYFFVILTKFVNNLLKQKLSTSIKLN